MRLVILDRDGVINRDSPNHIRSADQWEPLPGSLSAISRLTRDEYRVVVATNQSGVSRGYFDLDALNRIHSRMVEQLRKLGGRVDAIFVCPHGPDDGCNCRKPAPGMFLGIADRLGVRLNGVPAVGDSLRDLSAASKVGALPIYVLSGKNERDLMPGSNLIDDDLGEVATFADLAEFTDALLGGDLDEASRGLGASKEDRQRG